MSREEARFFSRGGRWALTGGSAALALLIFLLVFGEAPSEVSSYRADSFSRSAIGFLALVRFLEASDVDLLVGRHQPEASLDPDAGLLLLEPPAAGERGAELGELLIAARERRAPVLVVLPRWQGRPDPRRPTWVQRIDQIPDEEAADVLRILLHHPEPSAGESLIRRLEAAPRDGFEGVWPEADGVELPQPQLLDVAGLEPLIWSSAGALVAKSGRITIVADPDLFNTAGLGRGANATVAHHLFAGEGAPQTWIVDETLHGFVRAPNVWRELLAFPLVLFTLQVVLIGLLALWIGRSRIGAPLPAPPRISSGLSPLIDNTARLLDAGRHDAYVVERYFESALRSVARALGVREGGSREDLIRRLAEIEQRRSLTGRGVRRLAREIDKVANGIGERQTGVLLARRIHAWRRECLHGSR